MNSKEKNKKNHIHEATYKMNEPIYINKGRIGQYLYKTAFVNQIKKSSAPHTRLSIGYLSQPLRS